MTELSLHFAGRDNRIVIPDDIILEVAIPNELPVIPDASGAILQAVLNPIGCPRLKDSVGPDKKIAVMVTDITRKIPDDLVVTHVLDELNRAGVPDNQVKVIIATGLHRPNTPQEIEEMLGREVVRRVEVINHLAGDPSQVTYLGKTKSGMEISLNRHVVEADVRIATGVIEPHKLAGYSGGVKTMSVGAAGEATIRSTHDIELFNNPSMKLGVIEKNIFRECLTEIAMTVGLDFVINVIQNGQKELVGAVAGHPMKAFEAGVEIARRQCEVQVSQPADLVLAVPGYPKERDAYQASRAMNTVIFGPRPAVNQGGTILVPAPCQDGFGHKGVYDYLASVENPKDLLEKFRREGLPVGGAGVAHKIAEILQIAEIYYTDCLIGPDVLKKMHLKAADTLQQAIDEVVLNKKPKTILVMPYAIITLPIFNG